MPRECPPAEFDAFGKMINAEDDMVWIYLEWSGGDHAEGAPRLEKTIEIFRVEDGMMAEHWDMLQIGTGSG